MKYLRTILTICYVLLLTGVFLCSNWGYLTPETSSGSGTIEFRDFPGYGNDTFFPALFIRKDIIYVVNPIEPTQNRAYKGESLNEAQENYLNFMSVTAKAILFLNRNGCIDMDEDINVYLKQPLGHADSGRYITPKQLLLHIAGIDPDITYGFLDNGPLSLRQVPTKIQFDNVPGLVYKYAFEGYVLLAILIEDVTNLPFGQFIERNILKPHQGQKEAIFTVPGYSSMNGNIILSADQSLLTPKKKSDPNRFGIFDGLK